MKILFVDDEPAVTELYTLLARKCGFDDIDTATTGEEGVSRSLHGEYDLITLDINMPGLSGLEVLAVMRGMSPHAIVALISGNIPEQLPERVAEMVDVVIDKPVNRFQFEQLLIRTAQYRDALGGIRGLGRMGTSVADNV